MDTFNIYALNKALSELICVENNEYNTKKKLYSKNGKEVILDFEEHNYLDSNGSSFAYGAPIIRSEDFDIFYSNRNEDVAVFNKELVQGTYKLDKRVLGEILMELLVEYFIFNNNKNREYFFINPKIDFCKEILDARIRNTTIEDIILRFNFNLTTDELDDARLLIESTFEGVKLLDYLHERSKYIFKIMVTPYHLHITPDEELFSYRFEEMLRYETNNV